MRRALSPLVVLVAAAGLLATAFPAGRVPDHGPPPAMASVVDPICASCAEHRSGTPALSDEQIEALVLAYAGETGPDGPALEALLFHGPRVVEFVADRGTPGLDGARSARLRRELARCWAWVSLVAIDEEGVERIRLGPAAVPLDVKTYLVAQEVRDLQPPDVSWIVRRVGVDRLWSRI